MSRQRWRSRKGAPGMPAKVVRVAAEASAVGIRRKKNIVIRSMPSSSMSGRGRAQTRTVRAVLRAQKPSRGLQIQKMTDYPIDPDAGGDVET